jgi:hypothetical protein
MPSVHLPAHEFETIAFETDDHAFVDGQARARESAPAVELSELMALYRLEGAFALDARMV